MFWWTKNLLYIETGPYFPDEAARCDSSSRKAITFPSRAMGEEVPTLQ